MVLVFSGKVNCQKGRDGRESLEVLGRKGTIRTATVGAEGAGPRWLVEMDLKWISWNFSEARAGEFLLCLGTGKSCYGTRARNSLLNE